MRQLKTIFRKVSKELNAEVHQHMHGDLWIYVPWEDRDKVNDQFVQAGIPREYLVHDNWWDQNTTLWLCKSLRHA